MAARPTFHERRRFLGHQAYVYRWLGLAIGLLTPVAGIALAGDSPVARTASVAIGCVAGAAGLALSLFFWFGSVETRVDDGVLEIRARPFVRRRIRCTDIAAIHLRVVDQQDDWSGGWNSRDHRLGELLGGQRASSGNLAVRGQTTDGRPFQVGSFRAGRLLEAIAAHGGPPVTEEAGHRPDGPVR